MSITSAFRLVLTVLSIAGLLVSSVVAWLDLHVAPEHERRRQQAAEGPVLCCGQVDVDGGIRRLAPALTGLVKEVCVQEEQEVEAGAPLVRLEDEPARLGVRQAEADLELAKVQWQSAQKEPQRHITRLDQQKAAVEAARKNSDASRRYYDRLRGQHKETRLDIDVQVAEDQWHESEARFRGEQAKLEELKLHDPSLTPAQARYTVERRQIQLDLAKVELRKHELQAPEKGKVLQILVGRGDFVAGVAGQPALYFCPDRPRIVRADVSQAWASQLCKGDKVTLRDDDNPRLQWCGEVRQVSDWLTKRRSIWRGPQEMHDQHTAECIIEPKPGPNRLRIGQKLRVIAACGEGSHS